MRGADSADGNAARARNAHDLPLIVDCGGGTRRIAGEGRKLLHLAVRAPDHRAKLQDLEIGVAGRIYGTVLGPTNHLPTVVRSGGGAVASTRAWRHSRHHPVFPTKPLAYLLGWNA